MTWLFETLVWTGALIALVLVLRRPTARCFGARTAYTLWLLPFLRLFLPPIVLPAPEATPVETAPIDLSLAPAGEVQSAAVQSVGTAIVEPPHWLPMLETVIVAVWLAGAALYIILRLSAYQRLRAHLLVDARTVGEVGAVRLLETPATRSPLAFGVFDKVVALPVGFMALSDRSSRDLALAHELAHHRARDLAANFAALPLFALHWFNPLSWLGWRAMRRDQEAACDARVIEGRDRIERARYAALIAGTAAEPAPRVALAAPMACPVLGDKSIIQRLRNLTMNDLSVRRRRMGGAFVGLALLTLPLTASITYAQANEVDGIDPPVVPPAPPAPPAAPEAPIAPPAPAAPVAPLAAVDPSADVGHIELRGKEDGARIRHKFVIRSSDGEALAPDSPEFKKRLAELDKHLAELDAHVGGMAHFDDARVKAIEIEARRAGRAARSAEAIARAVPRIEESCDGATSTTETRTENGRQVIRICRKFAMAGALDGLRSARAAIAGNKEMSPDIRREILQELDSEIESLKNEPQG